jgi:hypothetical protein
VTALLRRSSRVVATGAAALAITAAAAFAPSAHAAGVQYLGETSPQDSTDDGVDNPTPEPFGFGLDGSSISNVQTYTSLRCPDGSYMNMGTLPEMPGEPFPVTNGHFDATIGDPNEGFGLTFHLVGDIANGRATGTAQVQAHEFSGVAPSGDVCTSSFSWTASTSAPPEPDPNAPPRVELTPPAPGGARPAASLVILALRSPDRRFFWGTQLVRCQNATNLVFTVKRNRRLLSRRRIGCRRRIALASSAVRPHRTYALGAQPVRIRRGRVVARGPTYRLRLTMPGNEANWAPIGTPAAWRAW